MLTKVLYKQHGNLELDPTRFKQMIEEADPRLWGLFDKLVKALIPDNWSAYNKVEAKKTIVSLCYIIAGMQNKFVNDLSWKLDYICQHQEQRVLRSIQWIVLDFLPVI